MAVFELIFTFQNMSNSGSYTLSIDDSAAWCINTNDGLILEAEGTDPLPSLSSFTINKNQIFVGTNKTNVISQMKIVISLQTQAGTVKGNANLGPNSQVSYIVVGIGNEGMIRTGDFEINLSP